MNKIVSLEVCCDGCTHLYVCRKHNHKRYYITNPQRLDRIRELVDRLPPPRVSLGANDIWLSFPIRPER